MMQASFKEDDVKKFTELLNMVADKAEFRLTVKELIEFYKLLAHAQTELLPKLSNHIMELRSVQQAKKEEPTPEPRRSPRSKK